MITLRPSAERGHGDFGWLNTKHSFSFGNYHDPDHMSFGALRVLNEDVVAPGKGFGRHPHRDAEILSYVVSGRLEHEDSLGGGSVLARGEVQRISAGKGVLHSEFNPSKTEPVHFLQIWLTPHTNGLAPRYDQKQFPVHERVGELVLIASSDGRDGSLPIYQYASVYAGVFNESGAVEIPIDLHQKGWIQVVAGSVTVEEVSAGAGDGLALEGVEAAQLKISDSAEILLFVLD